jgi:hypothetical protein
VVPRIWRPPISAAPRRAIAPPAIRPASGQSNDPPSPSVAATGSGAFGAGTLSGSGNTGRPGTGRGSFVTSERRSAPPGRSPVTRDWIGDFAASVRRSAVTTFVSNPGLTVLACMSADASAGV